MAISRAKKMSTNKILLATCIVQFAFLYYVLTGRNHQLESGTTTKFDPIETSPLNLHPEKNAKLAEDGMKAAVSGAQSPPIPVAPKVFSGVAATLMLHSPKWFQRRYTAMVQNMLNNIPLDWAVQIFYIPNGGSQRGLEINPGIGRLIERGDGRVVLTPMPESVWRKKSRRSDFFLVPWFWEAMVADKVLLFGGNSVICSNSFVDLSNFTHFDYIGGPWRAHGGHGGSGEISVRSRPLMLRIIKDQLQRTPSVVKDFTNHWGMEDDFFVKNLVAMVREDPKSGISLATYEDSLRFSSKDGILNFNSFAATGTLGAADDVQREEFLAYCPELKVIFPVLHNPHCFGAQPDAQKCAASICALKTDRKGGC
jgi:hypothetical protein